MRSVRETSLRQGPQMGKAMTWMGQIREKQEGGAGEAEALFTGALSQEDTNSADAALTMEFYARFLRGQDRINEAEVMETRAANVRKTLIATAGSASVGLSITGGGGGVFKVGGGVTAPHLLYKVEPQYTEEARAEKIAGTVLLYVVIEPDGSASNFKILRGMGFGLDEKAVEAIGQWKFKPGMKDGLPVPVQASDRSEFPVDVMPVERVNLHCCAGTIAGMAGRGPAQRGYTRKSSKYVTESPPVQSPTPPKPTKVSSVPCRMRR